MLFRSTKKQKTEIEETIHVPNEKLLHTILTNNFNVLYSNSLTNEQKEELKNILSLSNEEIDTKTKELKESLGADQPTVVLNNTSSKKTVGSSSSPQPREEVDDNPTYLRKLIYG